MSTDEHASLPRQLVDRAVQMAQSDHGSSEPRTFAVFKVAFPKVGLNESRELFRIYLQTHRKPAESVTFAIEQRLAKRKATEAATKMANADRGGVPKSISDFASAFPTSTRAELTKLYRHYQTVYGRQRVKRRTVKRLTPDGFNGIPQAIRMAAKADVANGFIRERSEIVAQFGSKKRVLAEYKRAVREYTLRAVRGDINSPGPSLSQQIPFVVGPDLTPRPKRKKQSDSAPAAPTGWHRANLSDEVRQRLRQGSRDFNDS